MKSLPLTDIDAFNILNTVTDAVIVIDAEGFILYANPSTEPLLDRENVIGKNCGLPIGISGESIDVQLVRKEGIGWAQLRSAPIQWAGQSAMVLTLADITELKNAQQRISESEASLKAMFDNLPFLAWMKDTESRLIHVNKHWLKNIGAASIESVIGKTDYDFWPQDLAEHYRDIDLEVMQTREKKKLIEKAINNGTEYWVETLKSPVVDDFGKVIGTVGLARDVTQERESQEQLQLTASIYEFSSEGMIVTDAEYKIIAVNAAFTQLTGFSAAEVIGKNPNILSSKTHDTTFFQAIWTSIKSNGCWQGEICDRKKNGELHTKRLTINTIPNSRGEPYRYIGLFSDITELKKNEALIWHQANYDFLTKLPNRRLFQDRLDQEIIRANRLATSIAVLFIDLDQFKEVNDTLGHHAGDVLLVEVAKRIEGCLRTSDTVSRFGGDEFMVILTDMKNNSDIECIAQKILLSLAKPITVDHELFFITGSIGITTYPNDAETSEELVRNADQAMYASKNAGRNRFSYFTSSMQEKALARLKLTSELRSAVENNELHLFYQPIVELATGKICKAEALVRWFHPTRGIVSPADFIPLAESTGLIVEMGDWIFKEAAQFAKHLSLTTNQPFQISVNKSPIQFHQRLKNDDWMVYLTEIDLPAKQIVVEITEGLLLELDSSIKNRLLEYRDAGIEVAIDDFGTGYSSLAYLNKFDIDYLKIDQSFTKNIQLGSSDLAISEAIIVMAHKLGLKIIAEGVETEVQRDLLAAAGCDYLQGYFYSRPIPANDFELLLSKNINAIVNIKPLIQH